MVLIANEKGVGGAPKGSLEEFYNIINIVKQNIKTVSDSTESLRNINQALLISTTEESEISESKEIDKLVSQGNKSAKIAQSLLKDLNKECKTIEEDIKNNMSSDLRIRKNLVQTLTIRYMDELRNQDKKSGEVNNASKA
jgi:polyhydroxyalkanoate synthesis regulator phasin